MKRTLAAAAAACSGRLQGVDRDYGAVSTDSRTLSKGELFVALKGPRFDGHDFIDAVAGAGAAGAIVSRLALRGDSLPQIVVADTIAALTALARAWRNQFDIPIVGVGGSNGKTTVKEMIAAILGQSPTAPCLATRGNLNNHIGVPLTLLRLDASHRSAVVEMGANRRGDVAELAAVARPTVGLITNAGAEHLEGFGDLEGVARGEGEMVATLPKDGVAVINADDTYAPLWRRLSGARRVVSFGLGAAADFHAADISQSIAHGEFALNFTLQVVGVGHLVKLSLAGRHNVTNALAAAAAAHCAGADIPAIVAGLESVRAVSGRLELKRARCGAWLIDDSYNANPSSVRVALEVLAELPGTRWIVLGDMAELGGIAELYHSQAGAAARQHGVTRLFATGPLSAHAAQAFGTGAEWFPDVEALIHRMNAELATAETTGVTVLIKGSRMNRLERVVAALAGAAAVSAH
jgi:UDP-N-acetylmuramoyl-tripeptide--D-alanyl-D-alanine ligase